MTASLPSIFRSVVARIVEHSPGDSGDWRIEERDGTCELTIPKLADDGFEITVVADDQEVTVFSEYLAHQHFTSDGNHEEVSQQAMGLVRDLLSPAMRLRVVEIGGKPSRADFEVSADGFWHRESTTGLLLPSFFRKKIERFYTNRRLPVRNEPNQPPQTTTGSEAPGRV